LFLGIYLLFLLCMKNGNLSRRVMSESGVWYHFCNVCGEYKPESEFYKKSKNPFRLDTKCKIHHKKKQPIDPEMSYLNLHAVQKSDFVQAQVLLESIGYYYCDGCPSVHEQFMKKNEDKWQNKNSTEKR